MGNFQGNRMKTMSQRTPQAGSLYSDKTGFHVFMEVIMIHFAIAMKLVPDSMTGIINCL
jgi:hypothetical protein